MHSFTRYQNIREYQDIDELDANMQQVNPIYVLRNHMYNELLRQRSEMTLVRLTAYLSYSTIPIQGNQIWKKRKIWVRYQAMYMM